MYSTFRSNAPAAETNRQPKPKRAQVSRACDACRIARAKCDSGRPCNNCQKSGRECVSASRSSRTQKPVSAQTLEIERLRARVQELESRQERQPLTTPPAEKEPQAPSQPQCWNWKGTAKDGVQYGPISDQTFIHRLSAALSLDVSPPDPPTFVFNSSVIDLEMCDRLERSQQDYFFDLFWLSYHVNFPALDEAEFRDLYASLWMDDGTRQADPLVDIILALNMQYAFSYLGDDGSAGEEAAVAGKAFYHRCQVALGQAAEAPSMKSVQCIFFSAIYLSYAKCYNSAHTTVKMACNMLSALSTDHLDSRGQNLYTRVRRCIGTLDTRLSFKLGRFTSTQLIPPELAVTTSPEDFDWTIYHVHLLSLCHVTQSIYTNFMARIDHLIAEPDTFYTSPSVRDHCATILSEEMKALDNWVAQVPDTLKNPRISGAPAFSTHRSSIDFQNTDQQWIQRQRLALECQFHSFCIALLRQFIHYAPTPLQGTFNANSLCIRCVNHAIMLTSIITQGMKETDILRGCYQAFEWQQDATYALAGFATGNPVCPPTPAARKALTEAGETFDCFGQGSQAAVRMQVLTREFDGKIRERITKFRGGMGTTLTPPDSVEGLGAENIDPRLRGPDAESVQATPDSMSSFLADWPSLAASPASQGLWDSIMAGQEQT